MWNFESFSTHTKKNPMPRSESMNGGRDAFSADVLYYAFTASTDAEIA